MDAALVLERAVHAISFDHERDVPESPERRARAREEARPPALPFRIPRVHAEELRCEDLSFIAADACPDFHHDVLRVEGVAGVEECLELALHAITFTPRVREILLGECTELGVGTGDGIFRLRNGG